MNEKVYKSINEVSKILDINTNIIRYWDTKLGISKQSNTKKQKFFNSLDIKKLKELKDTLYNNGKYNYSLDLAKKILSKKSRIQNYATNTNKENNENIEDLKEVRKNLNKILDI